MKPGRGHTLLELIIAMFLFAIVVPLFAGIWTLSHRHVRNNSAHLAGGYICHTILEQAINAGYSGVDALAATAPPDRQLVLKRTVTEKSTETPVSTSQDKTYSWSLGVQTSSDDPTIRSGEKLVNVNVEWKDGNETKNIQMSTLLTENHAI